MTQRDQVGTKLTQRPRDQNQRSRSTGISGHLQQNTHYVGTDYIGLGTAGPHPYLIGEGEARSVLDAVRAAARQMTGIGANGDTIVWGHSQGGNAALWTGIIAPTYAPELAIDGVVAIAPASDLRALIDVVQYMTVGRIFTSFALRAYSETYSDVAFDDYLSKRARLTARDISSRCSAGPAALVSMAEAVVTGNTIFGRPPISGNFGERLAQNTPSRPIKSALMIAQGTADQIVLPDIQTHFVNQRCEAGQAITYIRYNGRNHLSIVAPDSALTEDLVKWTQDQLAHESPGGECRDELH